MQKKIDISVYVDCAGCNLSLSKSCRVADQFVNVEGEVTISSVAPRSSIAVVMQCLHRIVYLSGEIVVEPYICVNLLWHAVVLFDC